MHKTQNRADTYRIWTEIETLQGVWLLSHKGLTM